MKKIILGIAVAGLALSCQKIQSGSNKGVLRMEDGVERWNQDEKTNTPSTAVAGGQPVSLPQLDSLRTGEVQEVQIKKDSSTNGGVAEQKPAEKVAQ